jgi:hypothetical protein
MFLIVAVVKSNGSRDPRPFPPQPFKLSPNMPINPLRKRFGKRLFTEWHSHGCEPRAFRWVWVMNRLRVRCIKCGKEWEKDSVICWGPDDFSSSLCNVCFRQLISPIIHRKQLNEGSFDCFGKAGSYCDQCECKYRKWCLRKERAEEAQERLRPRA